jgi:peptidoglycan/LPS O-acetylase OafA/YrhL
MSTSLYRHDIDALRAIAVLAVLFFHLDVAGFSGGYVGVDVFFVISGYLITGLVNKELNAGTFSLSCFYVRRIRRLAPSLLVMLVPISIAAFVLLKPEDLRSFGLSLAFQFASLQNLIFLAEGEYFRGADMKPLLHTWSLAVEEQFYLVWPMCLLLLHRRSLKIKIILILFLICGSFALNLLLMNISPKASFLLLPPRAWELGVGCLTAIVEANVSLFRTLTSKIRLILTTTGFFALVISICMFTSETPFPGIAALLPVFGTVFLLLSHVGSLNTFGTLATNPFLVRIGLISYPMYIWHWPLASLSRQLKIDPTSPIYATLIILLTIALAEMTYRFVELPVRLRKFLCNSRTLLITVGFWFVLLVGLGVHILVTDGASYRYSPFAKTLLTAPFMSSGSRCGFGFRLLHPQDQVCMLQQGENVDRRILLWGNSHADMWSGLLTNLAKENEASLYLNARNCRATQDSSFCSAEVQQSILNFINSKKITDVILASTWHDSYNISDKVFEEQLAKVVQKILKSDIRVWLVIDVPSDKSLNPLFAYEKNPSDPKFGFIPFNIFLKQKIRQEVLFKSLALSSGNVRIIDPSVNLCNEFFCPGGLGDKPWYRDENHLTNAGANVVFEQFLPIFVKIN